MSIRTTVTLDDDVQQRVKDFSKTKGIPFRAALNELVRSGWTAESSPRTKEPFIVKPFHMGVVPGINYDKISALLEFLEGPLYR